MKSRAFRTVESSERKEPIPYASVLMGVMIGILVFTGFVLMLVMADLVWNSPNRSWFIGGAFFTYLTGTILTSRALARRLHAWRPLDDLQIRIRSDRQNLGRLFQSGYPGRIRSAGDF